MFIAALKSSLPALSFRVVTDLGDRNALRDFRAQVRPRSRELYRYLGGLLESGWFGRFLRALGPPGALACWPPCPPGFCRKRLPGRPRERLQWPR